MNTEENAPATGQNVVVSGDTSVEKITVIGSVHGSLGIGGSGSGSRGRPDAFSWRDFKNTMERRSFLLTIGAGLGFSLTDGAVEAVRLARSRTEQYLAEGVPARGVFDAWEEAVHEHALRYATSPPLPYLHGLLSDFLDLQDLLESCRLPDAQKRSLRLMGRVSGMVAVVADDLGRPEESGKWMRLARRLFTEIRDRESRAWTFARGGFIALHYSGSPSQASHLAQAAVDTAPRRSVAASVMGHTVESRAYAVMGDERSALRALESADQARGTAPSSGPLGLFGWTEQQATLSRGMTLSTLGLTEPALAAQEEALALFDASEWLDPALVRLDQAALFVRRIDVREGCRLAASVLEGIPSRHHSPLLASWADDVIQGVPPQMAASPEAEYLWEVRRHFAPKGEEHGQDRHPG